MAKNIELEIRAEIKKDHIRDILKYLRSNGRLVSETKRLSVMYFGRLDGAEFDIRVRITNGEAEVVIKRGEVHSHNRTEVSQSITKDQFMGMVKVFLQLGIPIVKAGERDTKNFKLKNGIIASLVQAGDIYYIEIEKISSKKDEKANKELLENIAGEMNLKIIRTRKVFIELCDRLNETVDWQFKGTTKDYLKLEKLLKKY